MLANGSMSHIDYTGGPNSVFSEPSVANNAMTTAMTMAPTMTPRITTATTEMAAVFPDTFRAESPPPDLDELYRLALQEQEYMNSNTIGSRSIPSHHTSSPISTASTDTGPTSPEPPATPADLFIPGPYDSILEDMFDRQFWKQQRHRLAWSERMSPVQSQLVGLLCNSYHQLHTTTEEPQHTKAFFYHTSKVRVLTADSTLSMASFKNSARNTSSQGLLGVMGEAGGGDCINGENRICFRAGFVQSVSR
jgi:hypothetical protein